jgi:hypothetical protein
VNKPKRTVSWFRHYCRHGDSLKIVEGLWKEKGFTCWFKLLERLGAAEGHTLNLEKDIKKFMLVWSESGLKPEQGREVMDLFADLEMIDPILYKHNIVYTQNLVDGVLEVYRNRKSPIPQKPTLPGINPKPTGSFEENTPSETGIEIEEVEEVEEDYVEQPLLEDPELTESLEILRSVRGYPFDVKEDSDYLAGLIAEFKELDPVEVLKDWIVFLKDQPFKKNSRPRTQLRNTFKFSQKYGKCGRKAPEGHSTGLIAQIQKTQEELHGKPE